MKTFFLFILLLILQLSKAQHLAWAKAINGNGVLNYGSGFGQKSINDAAGNSFIAGNFSGTMDFDPGPGTFILTSSSGNIEYFVVKLDKSGNFVWAIHFAATSTTTAFSDILDIALDDSANVYTTGNFYNTMDFDPGSGTYNLTASSFDMFLSKLDSSGHFKWAKKFGASTDQDAGHSIAIDAQNNVYTTGNFKGTVDFDPGTGTYNLVAGLTSMFVLKLSPAGDFIWAKSIAGASGTVIGYSIQFDRKGKMYLNGHFSGTVDFDPGTGTQNLTTVGSFDCFVLKLDSVGNYLWVRKFGGTGWDVAASMGLDTIGNVYSIGYFLGTVDFDPGSGTYNLTATGNYDVFISKLNSSGNFVWAKKIGGPLDDYGRDVAVDAIGNSFTVGGFQGNVDFDPGTTTDSIKSNGGLDVFILRLDSSGTYINAKKMGGTGEDHALGITFGDSGVIYMTGQYIGTADFDPDTTTFNLNSGNGKGCFYLKLLQTPSKPVVILGDSNICSGSVHIWSVAPVPGATSYTWTLPSGWSGSSSKDSITITTGSTGGILTVTANNNFGASSPQSISITVNGGIPTNPGSISGNTTVCSSSSNTYSISTVSDATYYSWLLPQGWTGSSYSNSIIVVAGNNTDSIKVRAVNGCGASSYQKIAVTVINIPATPGTINGNNPICSGSSNTYSVGAVNGATSYTWTLPNGWTGTSTSNSINTTAGATGGIITVKANNSCGSSSISSKTITVDTIPPVPGSISGNTEVCSGSSNTYSISAIGGASSYTWTLPSGWTGSSTSNSISVVAGSTSGNLSVTANNYCGSSSAKTLGIIVNTSAPSTPGTINGNNNICAGTSNTYYISSVSGASSYTWSLPSGWTGSSTSTSITLTSGTNNGTITVKANNSCGSSSVQSLPITVTNAPSTPGSISGNTSICSNSINTYSIASVSGATSYLWTLPSGWTGTSTTNSIIVTCNSTSGNISVKANNTCGSSSAQTLAVGVTNIPATPGTITGSVSVCIGSSNTYSISGVSGASSYTWTLPSGWTGSSSSNSISVIPGSTGGNISVVASNFCGTSAANTLSVVVNSSVPSNPGLINGDTEICAYSTYTYSIANVSGASSYSWILPNGWTGYSTGNSINLVPSTNSGIISVFAVNGCGSSAAAQSISVRVNSTLPSFPGSINGSTSICSGKLVTYYINPVGAATSYTWTLPNGWTGSSKTNTIDITPDSFSGNISVKANNACGSSSIRSLAITVNKIPQMPGTINSSTNLCKGAGNTYFITPVNGATSYTWSLPPNWSGSSVTNAISIIPADTGVGLISVTANNSCGSSLARTMMVNVSVTPQAPQAITGDTNVCIGTTNSYSVVPVSGATSYSWKLPNGWSGSSTSNNIIATAVSSGVIEVKAVNSCGSSISRLLFVNVTSLPSTPELVFGDSIICSGKPTNYSVKPVIGATSYTWILPGGWLGFSSNNNILITPDSNSGTVSVIAWNACGASLSKTFKIIVIPSPSINVSVFPSASICMGEAVTLSAFSASSYQWSDGVVNGVPFVPVITKTYSVKGFSLNGCSTSKLITITVNPLPSFSSQPLNQLRNVGSNAIFVASSTASGVVYQWQRYTGTGFENITNSTQYGGTTNDTLIVINVNLSQDNNKFRCIIGDGNCSDTSNTALLNVKSGIGVEGDLKLNDITIHPNPAHDFILIKSNKIIEGGNFVISDISGKVILYGKTDGLNTYIGIENLAEGFYIVRVTSSMKNSTSENVFKFIKN